MNVKLQHKTIAALLVFLISNIQIAAAQSNHEITKENVNKKSELVVATLGEGQGSVNKKAIIATIGAKYPGYKLVSACVGSFRAEGERDVALGLFNPVLQRAVYAVVMEEGQWKFVSELANFEAKFNKFGSVSRDIEVVCHSWTDLYRIVHDFKEVRLETPSANATLRPISHFDAICTVPPQGDAEYECYGHDPRTKKLQGIGAWFNG